MVGPLEEQAAQTCSVWQPVYAAPNWSDRVAHLVFLLVNYFGKRKELRNPCQTKMGEDPEGLTGILTGMLTGISRGGRESLKLPAGEEALYLVAEPPQKPIFRGPSLRAQGDVEAIPAELPTSASLTRKRSQVQILYRPPFPKRRHWASHQPW